MSASSKLKALAQSWPADPFRPNMQLQNFLRSLSAHPELTPQAVRAVEALRTNELQKKVNMAPLFLFFLKNKTNHGYLPPFFTTVLRDAL